MADAARSSKVMGEVGGRERELFPRFAKHYDKLRALPRKMRRAVQRKWKHTLAGVALLMALGGASSSLAATITVDGVNCTIVNAVTTANTTGGCVLSDALGGADTIVLPADSTQTLTAVDNTTFGATGIPVIESEITIQGNGSTITRMTEAGNFRIIAVNGSGNLTLENTTISGGMIDGTMPGLDDGGGIANYGGTVTLTGSTATGSSAYSAGGGVYNFGTMTLTNSTVSGNSAAYVGGVYNSFVSIMTLTNSTVSGNSAFIFGGVYNDYGTMTLTNSTVSGNSANNYGGVVNFDGTMTLSRTIVSGNTGGSSPEVYNFAIINADDFNLFGFNGSSGTNFTPGDDDIVPASGVMVSDILAPLALNPPGTTQTHALVTGSPAIDASPDDASCEATDQRGVIRPQGAACDIGAFELEVAVTCAGRAPTTGCTVNGVANQLCVGTAGRDRIIGTSGNDVILGLAGNDTIAGAKGNDLVCGGMGNNIINGGLGNDELRGMMSRDTINGGDGRDRLFGGANNDTLNGGNGNDFVDGVDGTDTCDGGAGTDRANRCEIVTSVP